MGQDIADLGGEGPNNHNSEDQKRKKIYSDVDKTWFSNWKPGYTTLKTVGFAYKHVRTRRIGNIL